MVNVLVQQPINPEVLVTLCCASAIACEHGVGEGDITVVYVHGVAPTRGIDHVTPCPYIGEGASVDDHVRHRIQC